MVHLSVAAARFAALAFAIASALARRRPTRATPHVQMRKFRCGSSSENHETVLLRRKDSDLVWDLRERLETSDLDLRGRSPDGTGQALQPLRAKAPRRISGTGGTALEPCASAVSLCLVSLPAMQAAETSDCRIPSLREQAKQRPPSFGKVHRLPRCLDAMMMRQSRCWWIARLLP